MKVLMLLSNPFVADMRPYLEAQALIKHGHEVTLIGWDRKGEYAIEDEKDGIRIIRIRNTSFMNALPYDIMRLFLMWKVMAKRAMKEDFDIIHAHDLDTIPAGIRLKKLKNVPLIYDAHEIWPTMIERDIKHIIPWYFRHLDKRAMKHIDGLIIPEDDTYNLYYYPYFRNLGYKGPVGYVMNAKPLLYDSYAPPENDVFTLIYIGVLTRPRFLLEAIDVVESMDGIRFIIAGSGPIEDEIRARVKDARNTEFIGRIPVEEVLPRTRNADAVFCMIDPSDYNNRVALANKQFEAMATGRPIITSRGTMSGRMTEELGVGLVVEHSKEGLREALEKLMNEPDLAIELGKRAFEWAKKKYNWPVQEKRLLELYASITGEGGL